MNQYGYVARTRLFGDEGDQHSSNRAGAKPPIQRHPDALPTVGHLISFGLYDQSLPLYNQFQPTTHQDTHFPVIAVHGLKERVPQSLGHIKRATRGVAESRLRRCALGPMTHGVDGVSDLLDLLAHRTAKALPIRSAQNGSRRHQSIAGRAIHEAKPRGTPVQTSVTSRSHMSGYIQ